MMEEDRTSVELTVDDLLGKTARELRDHLEALVPDVSDRGVSVSSTHYVTSVRIDFSYSSLPASGDDLTRATALTVAALHAWGQVNCPHRVLSYAWWLKLRPNAGRPVSFGLMDALLALVTAEESSEVARWLARIGIPCMSRCPGLTAGAWSGYILREGTAGACG